MRQVNKSPAELRSMFGANLRQLARQYPSISELSRQLGINRTQFNRYLAGESFPRPDVLSRICDFFDVDARVLLEPVASLQSGTSEFSAPELQHFMEGATEVPENLFPSGFFRFSRRSFMDPENYVLGLVRVWRGKTGQAFLRGFEARQAMQQQGLSNSAKMREFRGMVLRLESGIGILVSRHGTTSVSFNFLHPVVSFENNFWTGYLARTVPETMDSERIGRLVYEHLGTGLSPARQVAKDAGIVPEDKVPDFHLRLLKGQTAFR